jgi:hypothetical protein
MPTELIPEEDRVFLPEKGFSFEIIRPQTTWPAKKRGQKARNGLSFKQTPAELTVLFIFRLARSVTDPYYLGTNPPLSPRVLAFTPLVPSTYPSILAQML